MLGFCPAGGGSIGDRLAPFPAAQMPLGRQAWQRELGLTQDGIYSNTGKRMEGTEEKIATRSFGAFSVASLERLGRVSEAQSGPELRANSWSKGEMREETQPLPLILLPLPLRAPARAVLKPPAVPAPGGRSIVGMGLVGSKSRAPRSDLLLQCLCSIPAVTSHSPKTSLTHPLLASEGLGLAFGPVSGEKAGT